MAWVMQVRLRTCSILGDYDEHSLATFSHPSLSVPQVEFQSGYDAFFASSQRWSDRKIGTARIVDGMDPK